MAHQLIRSSSPTGGSVVTIYWIGIVGKPTDFHLSRTTTHNTVTLIKLKPDLSGSTEIAKITETACTIVSPDPRYTWSDCQPTSNDAFLKNKFTITSTIEADGGYWFVGRDNNCYDPPYMLRIAGEAIFYVHKSPKSCSEDPTGPMNKQF